MFGYNPSANGRQLFENQFEPRGDGYVYRKGLKGAPIPVTAEERQRFIEDYGRSSRYGYWGMIAAWIFLVSVLVSWSLETGSQLSNVALFVGIGITAIGFVGYGYWTWGAPARLLARRTPIGHERSAGEFRRALLKKKSYSQILAPAAIAVLGCLKFAQKNQFAGWGLFWLLLAAVLLGLFGFQLLQKWRYERNSAGPKDDLGFPLSRE